MQEYSECQDTVDGVSAFLSACVGLCGRGKCSSVDEATAEATEADGEGETRLYKSKSLEMSSPDRSSGQWL